MLVTECVCVLAAGVFSLHSGMSVVWGSEVKFQGLILSAVAEGRQKSVAASPTALTHWAGKINVPEEEEEEKEEERCVTTSFPTFLCCHGYFEPVWKHQSL